MPRWRSALLYAAVLVLCYSAVVLPWAARNRQVHGTLAIAGGVGEGLAVRTIRYEQQFDFREQAAGDDAVLTRARRIYREEAREGSAFELARRLRDDLGVSELTADNLMRQIALGAIRAEPAYYLYGTAQMAGRTLVGRSVRLRQDWTPWRNIVWEPRVAHLLPAPTPAEERSFQTAEALAHLYEPSRLWVPLLAFFAVGGLSGLIGTRERPAFVLALVVMGLLLAGAALVGLEWRYRYPLDPLINTVAAGGLITSVQWAVASLRRWVNLSQRRVANQSPTADGGAETRTYPSRAT